MALSSRSLLLYNLEVTRYNQALDFAIAPLPGGLRQATLRLGSYSLNALLEEIVRALTEADPTGLYTYTIDRTFSGGTQNRVTITKSSGSFSLLFGSGPRAASSCATLLGYTATNKTGSLSYQSQSTAGTALITSLNGYTYLGPEYNRKVQGSVNISASGEKQAIVFGIMQFVDVEFRHEPATKVLTEWTSFFDWAIQQKLFEFTPQVASPATFYEVTLDSTAMDGKGLGMRWAEMLPFFPNYYQTGKLVFRRRLSSSFIVG